MPTSKIRTVHLHLVDISAGWHICKSLTPAEFVEHRMTRVFTQADAPLDDLVDLELAAEDTLSKLAAADVGADSPYATNGFMIFASLLEARLTEEVEPHDYVRSAGDWLLAVASPRPELSGPVILLTDYISRDDFVPLTGAALEHAVLSMLSRALPRDGFSLEHMAVHSRWAAGPYRADLT